jgi:hypothetical protein
MKRLAFGAAAAGGAAFALHRLAPKARAMHAHCRDMMRTQSSAAATTNQPGETRQCG